MREAQNWCNLHNIPYFETSAKDGSSLREAFITVAQNVFQADVVDPATSSFQLEPQVPNQPQSACNCTNNHVHINAEKCTN